MKKSEIINKIIKEYDIKKGIALSKRDEEMKRAYECAPELLDIDNKINELGFRSMQKILADSKNSHKINDELKKEMEKLKKEREIIIVKNGINPLYNKPVYECDKCSDTGFLNEGSSRCECFEKRVRELYNEDSQMGKMLDGVDFNSFELKYYSDNKEKKASASPRQIVGEALECAKYFCREFDNIDFNLFFYGDTGLGKTFLSSIIANEMIKKGKNVKYVRATRVFALYDDYKFKDYSLKEEIDDIYNCDLLVIDDLGTEALNKNGISFLFDLVNERLINKRKIIINTNLEISNFSKTYTVRLTSRIYESFKIFNFSGEDIRIRKLIEKNK